MKELKFKIEGMHCTGCSTRLQNVLNNLEEAKQAMIKYDEDKISIEGIREAIEDAGFKAE